MKVNESPPRDLYRLILDTARHFLVSEGYKNLSMRKIAGAIGYSATSIYLHFTGKDALVHTLIDEGMGRKYEAFAAVVAACPDDPVARFAGLCRAYIDFGLNNPEYYEIMYLLHPEKMARFPADKYRKARRNLEVIAETLKEGAAKGLMSVTDPLLDASVTWAALHGAVSLLFSQRMDRRVDPEEFVDAMVGRLLKGYVTDTAAV